MKPLSWVAGNKITIRCTVYIPNRNEKPNECIIIRKRTKGKIEHSLRAINGIFIYQKKFNNFPPILHSRFRSFSLYNNNRNKAENRLLHTEQQMPAASRFSVVYVHFEVYAWMRVPIFIHASNIIPNTTEIEKEKELKKNLRIRNAYPFEIERQETVKTKTETNLLP